MSHDDKAPSGSDDSGGRRQAPFSHRAQVMDRKVRGGDTLIRREARDNCKRRSRINQGSNRATVDHTLVLLELGASVQMD